MKIKIERDPKVEMIRIFADDKLFFEGNYWDLDDRDWVSLLKTIKVEVEEGVYDWNLQYKSTWNPTFPKEINNETT